MVIGQTKPIVFLQADHEGHSSQSTGCYAQAPDVQFMTHADRNSSQVSEANSVLQTEEQDRSSQATGSGRHNRTNVKKLTKRERIAAVARRQSAAQAVEQAKAWWKDDISRAERQLATKQRLRPEGDWIGVNASGTSTTFFSNLEDSHVADGFIGTDEEEVDDGSIQAMYKALSRNSFGDAQSTLQGDSSAGGGGRYAAEANPMPEEHRSTDAHSGVQLP